jgi:hypothetical protein
LRIRRSAARRLRLVWTKASSTNPS